MIDDFAAENEQGQHRQKRQSRSQNSPAQRLIDAIVHDLFQFIAPADLPEEIRALAPPTGAPDLDINRVARQAAEEAKKRLIHEAVDRARGNLSEAAGLLGVKPPNLHRLINELGLRADVEQLIRKLKPIAPLKK